MKWRVNELDLRPILITVTRNGFEKLHRIHAAIKTAGNWTRFMVDDDRIIDLCDDGCINPELMVSIAHDLLDN